MIIERKLKNHLWDFDEETKELKIWVFHPPGKKDEPGAFEIIKLDKTRWFSLFRFMIRASQRMSVKRRKQQGLFNKKK